MSKKNETAAKPANGVQKTAEVDKAAAGQPIRTDADRRKVGSARNDPADLDGDGEVDGREKAATTDPVSR